jgi:UDP-glucuronate 4-epimerase
MKILVTGTAGFIGYHLAKRLVEENYEVVGIDNINDYYDVELKYARLADSGIAKQEIKPGVAVKSSRSFLYRFIQADLADKDFMDRLFREEQFDLVCNLAAQAGVRYSIKNPYAYVQSNVVGFLNLLEACRHHAVKRLVYASSSSIYGMNKKVPFSEEDRTDTPESLYAATKKSDELMAYTYSKLYGLETIGLRLFTVYGPWGRPDMAPYLFLDSILHDREIRVFNHGDLLRDFTYVDDIVSGWCKVIDSPLSTESLPYHIYNVGNSSPIKLMDFIHVIEQCAGKEAKKHFEGMQPGDVYCTYADTSRLEKDFGYKPSTTLESGIRRFYEWYIDYQSKIG